MWPIAYLATKHPHVSVSIRLPGASPAPFQEALRDGRLFFVEFDKTQHVPRFLTLPHAYGNVYL
jgi:hypothetical protein